MCQERANYATVEILILCVCPEWAPTRQECATTPDWHRLTPESSACIFLPSGPSEPRVSHDWAPTYPTGLRTTPNEPGFSRLCHGGATNHAESSWFGLIRGSATKTLNFLMFSGRAPNQPRIINNHPDSTRTCYGSPRTTQTLLQINVLIQGVSSFHIMLPPNSHFPHFFTP